MRIADTSAAVPPTVSRTETPTTEATSWPLLCCGQRTVPPPAGRVAPSSTITRAMSRHRAPASTHAISAAGPAVCAANIAANSQPEPKMLEKPIAVSPPNPSFLRSRVVLVAEGSRRQAGPARWSSRDGGELHLGGEQLGRAQPGLDGR